MGKPHRVGCIIVKIACMSLLESQILILHEEDQAFLRPLIWLMIHTRCDAAWPIRFALAHGIHRLATYVGTPGQGTQISLLINIVVSVHLFLVGISLSICPPRAVLIAAQLHLYHGAIGQPYHFLDTRKSWCCFGQQSRNQHHGHRK